MTLAKLTRVYKRLKEKDIEGGNYLKRKDLLLGIMLCVPMLGFGHLYAGDKTRGLIILAVQVGLQILAGIAMFFSNVLTHIFYFAYLLVGFWAVYDTVVTIKLVNEHIK